MSRISVNKKSSLRPFESEPHCEHLTIVIRNFTSFGAVYIRDGDEVQVTEFQNNRNDLEDG